MTAKEDRLHALPIWGSLILFGVPTVLMWMATRGNPGAEGDWSVLVRLM